VSKNHNVAQAREQGVLMNTKRITFPNGRGERIAARLELPEDEQPLAYALFAHCFTCTKDLKAVVSISRAPISSPRGISDAKPETARWLFAWLL
jgi:hypothetical protein